jgi:hypothetical protein
MHPFKLDVSDDRNRLSIAIEEADRNRTIELLADEVDALVRSLVARRSKMIPVHPAEPPEQGEKLYMNDNLLWSVTAAPEISAIRIATQNPGLGWCAMLLSRAQVEDLQTCIAFALAQLQPSRYRPSRNAG